VIFVIGLALSDICIFEDLPSTISVLLQLNNIYSYIFFVGTFLQLNRDNIDPLPETSMYNSIISLP
jgi:hypothetical protein